MEVIATLLVALVFFLLGPFNPGPVTIDLMGFYTLNAPLNLMTFSLFLLGATYMAFWNLVTRLKTQSEMRQLKRTINELERHTPAPAVEKIIAAPVKAAASTSETTSEAIEETAKTSDVEDSPEEHGETEEADVENESAGRGVEAGRPAAPDILWKGVGVRRDVPKSEKERFVSAAKAKARAVLDNEDPEDSNTSAYVEEEADENCFWTRFNYYSNPQNWFRTTK